MKRTSRLGCLLLLGALLSSGSGYAHAQNAIDSREQTVTAYRAVFQAESQRVTREADRLRGEAGRVEAEATRLKGEERRLIQTASRLDSMWLQARRADASRVRDYPGRDRSQRILRRDARRALVSAADLELEGRRLNREAARLDRLAVAIDAEAQEEIERRFRLGHLTEQDATRLARQQVASLAARAGLRMPQGEHR